MAILEVYLNEIAYNECHNALFTEFRRCFLILSEHHKEYLQNIVYTKCRKNYVLIGNKGQNLNCLI